jgi:uncharacterized protein (TIGR00730 family)
MKILTIFCSGKIGVKQEYLEEIQTLVNSFDTQKITIAYGGGNVGLMGVVNDTYKAKGGKLITSNIKKFIVDGYPDDYIFDNITERQSKLIELGDIFLALPGGFGTIYELLEVITKNQIEEISKPVYIYNYKGVYDNLIRLIDDLQKEGFIKHDLEWYKIRVFTDPKELVDALHSY